MGWSFAYSRKFGKKELVAEIRGPEYFGDGCTLIDSSVVGNHFWGVVEKPDGSRYIFLALMASGGKEGGWGSKTLSEYSGPVALDCPLRLFKIAGPARADGYAVKWREDVHAFHAQKKTKAAALALCAVVTYGKVDYRLIRPVGGRRGWVVRRLSDGCEFRMNERQIAQAALAHTQAEESAQTGHPAQSQLETSESV